MDQDIFAGLSASEIARLVRARQVSPRDVIEAAIARTESRNPSLNAIIYTDFEQARLRARQLEQRIMQGETVGLLAGVPTFMKDLFDFKPGWPSTLGGIRALKAFKPDFYSNYPERMERADAILLGKTNSATFGFSGTTDNMLFGPTCNPFDTTKNSGGSSGAAAAVSDGIVPIAQGSDGGGSIRIPAAWSGAVGFQPSFGRLPIVMRPNAFGATAPFLYEGPIARDVADVALALNALAWFNPADPYSDETTIDYTSVLNRSLEGKKIGYTQDFGIFPVDRRISALIAESVRAFEFAGAHVEEMKINIPLTSVELIQLWSRMIASGTYAVLQNFKAGGCDILKDHTDDLPKTLREWVAVAEHMTLPQLQADQVTRTVIFDAFVDAFRRYDFIVSPTTACLAVDNRAGGDTVGPEKMNGVALEPRLGWAMTCFTNFIGHPAASLPAGLIGDLPAGLQIIGRRRADDDVIAACAAFERIRPWKAIYHRLRSRSLVTSATPT